MSKSKPHLPRGEYRARWEMPHSLDTDYKRSKLKKSTKLHIEEEEENINWCPKCGRGSFVMNDPLCAKCEKETELELEATGIK